MYRAISTVVAPSAGKAGAYANTAAVSDPLDFLITTQNLKESYTGGYGLPV